MLRVIIFSLQISLCFVWWLLVVADVLFPVGYPLCKGPLDAPRQPGCLTPVDCHKTAVGVQHLLASGSATCTDFALINLLCC